MDFQKISKDLIAYAWNIPRAILLAILLSIAFLFFKDGRKQALQKLKAFMRMKWQMAFILYLAFILMGTVFARQHTIPYARIFENFGFRDDPVWNKEIIENIILFIPYSMLFLQAFRPGNKLRATLTATLVTSGGIEAAQLIFWVGSFQFADILHNLIGGLLGWGLWCVLHKMRNHGKISSDSE